MSIITVTETRDIQVDDFAALPMQEQIVELAVQSLKTRATAASSTR